MNTRLGIKNKALELIEVGKLNIYLNCKLTILRIKKNKIVSKENSPKNAKI